METVGSKEEEEEGCKIKEVQRQRENNEEKERLKEAREENREVYERHRDHMVPPGPHDPSRLSHLTQHTHIHLHTGRN